MRQPTGPTLNSQVQVQIKNKTCPAANSQTHNRWTYHKQTTLHVKEAQIICMWPIYFIITVRDIVVLQQIGGISLTVTNNVAKWLKDNSIDNTSTFSFEARASITSRSPTIEPIFLSENQSKPRLISTSMIMIKYCTTTKTEMLF